MPREKKGGQNRSMKGSKAARIIGGMFSRVKRMFGFTSGPKLQQLEDVDHQIVESEEKQQDIESPKVKMSQNHDPVHENGEDTTQPSIDNCMKVVPPMEESATSQPKQGSQESATKISELTRMPTKGVSLRRVLEELGPEFLKTTKRCEDHYDRELISFKTPRDGYECFCCHRKQFPIHSSMYGCGCDSCEKALCAECFRADITTENAVAGVIKPMTSQDQVSVVELWENEQAKDGKKRVQETADFFFSHAWRYRIKDVLDVLHNVLQDQIAKKVAQGENEEDVDVFIWMDIFVINQHTNQQLSQEFVASGFHNAIATIGKVVIMITPWHAPHSMTRAWCLWELYGGIIKEVQTDLYMVPGEHEKFIDTLINDYHSIMKHLCKIDAAKAEAWDKKDLDMIMKEIKKPEGPGIEGVNEVVMSFLRDWVASSGSKELRRMETMEGFDESNSRMYAMLCNCVGLVYNEQGNSIEAERLFSKGLEVDRRMEGNEGINVAASLTNLAMELERNGRYDEAETKIREALAMERKVYGDEHPDVATSLNNLASVLDEQGKLDEAEIMHRKSLAIRKKVLGTSPHHVAGSLNNLALVLKKQGKYEEAEKMHRESLAIVKKVYGDNHPHVAVTLSNLGSLLHGQGKYDESEAMCRQALAISRKVYGDEHPLVAQLLSNLTNMLKEQGKYGDAEEMQSEVLPLRKKVYGDDSSDLETSSSRTCNVVKEKDEEEDDMVCDTLQVQVDQDMGEATSLSQVAHSLFEEGKYEEAAKMHRGALRILKEKHGDDHPKVAESLDNLALVLRSQGNLDEAEAMFRESLAIKKKVYGSDHPELEVSLNNLGSVLLDQGKYEEAGGMFRA